MLQLGFDVKVAKIFIYVLATARLEGFPQSSGQVTIGTSVPTLAWSAAMYNLYTRTDKISEAAAGARAALLSALGAVDGANLRRCKTLDLYTAGVPGRL